MSEFSRREMLSAAAAGGMIAAATSTDGLAEGQPPFGPTPPVLAGAQLPSFRFQLGAVAPKTWNGGWAKEATVAEFPVSEKLAGVLMSLVPGGLRELHWHANAAEWAYVIKGQCRVTTINPQGQSQMVDFAAGDVWYFPRGFGHSIQAIGSEDCLFVLVFDNGYFSEFGTFSITDWVGHTPPEVLAKNFGVPAATFANFPKREVYIAKGPVPPPLPADPAPGTLNPGTLTHRYRLLAQRPETYPGGTNRLVSQREFPISTTVTGALMRIKPGGMRELHWHPNADEWQYYISGRGRMTVFGSGGKARTFDYQAGDVGYVPFAMGHYVENTGPETLRFLELFRSDRFADVSLNQWMALTPPELVQAHLNLGRHTVEALSKTKPIVVR